MGLIQHGAPRSLVSAMRTQFDIECFIETGTFHGTTAEWAASNFGTVFTIEGQPSIHKIAQDRLRTRGNVRSLLGDSRSVLPQVFPQVGGRVLFWLDSHWSGGETYGSDDECPLRDELVLINASGLDAFVLIDDARLFLAPPPLPHDASQWPALGEVVRLLEHGGRRFSAVYRDVILGVPRYAEQWLQETLQQYVTQDWNLASVPSGAVPNTFRHRLYRLLRRLRSPVSD